MEITLIEAVFGMGNQNHDHVHRHNTLNPSTQSIDRLKMEQFQGGVNPLTLAQVAQEAGGISANPHGMVNIEDGWNIRRGIGLLKFVVENNSMHSRQLSVLGYLTGGQASHEGISEDTLFVPVRAWGTSSRNVADLMGYPTTKTHITSSTQFLMGDPFLQKKLKSVRAIDVGTESLGLFAIEHEGQSADSNFDGMLSADLSHGIVPSKTDNLSPTHHARELLKIAVSATNSTEGLLENEIGNSLMGASIGEESILDNEFFKVMMHNTGSYNLSGFQGWTTLELANVFGNFPEVLNLNLLDASLFSDANNLLESHEYGGANLWETIANELAYLTVHLLIKAGLTHFTFSATNDPNIYGGITGSEDGIEIIPGEFQSVFDSDDHALQRVEEFKQQLKNQFFSKYTGMYAHQQTIMAVEVQCFIFGETSVNIFFNGDQDNARRWVNASYAINRTSTNIAGKESGLNEARLFMSNVKDYFVE